MNFLRVLWIIIFSETSLDLMIFNKLVNVVSLEVLAALNHFGVLLMDIKLFELSFRLRFGQVSIMHTFCLMTLILILGFAFFESLLILSKVTDSLVVLSLEVLTTSKLNFEFFVAACEELEHNGFDLGQVPVSAQDLKL